MFSVIFAFAPFLPFIHGSPVNKCLSPWLSAYERALASLIKPDICIVIKFHFVTVYQSERDHLASARFWLHAHLRCGSIHFYLSVAFLAFAPESVIVQQSHTEQSLFHSLPFHIVRANWSSIRQATFKCRLKLSLKKSSTDNTNGIFANTWTPPRTLLAFPISLWDVFSPVLDLSALSFTSFAMCKVQRNFLLNWIISAVVMIICRDFLAFW